MKASNQIKDFLNHSNQILKRFEGQNNYPVHINFLIENCLRTYDLLLAIETITDSKISDKEYEHPLGILLRSGLYDFIYFQYVANKSVVGDKLDTEKFETEVREYMNGHFNYINPNLVLDDKLQKLDRFKDFGKKSKFKVLGILKEGKNFAVQKKLNYLVVAINMWEWYSKYEHYGVFTNTMYNNDENEHRKEESIRLLFANICLSLYTLSDIEPMLLKPNEVKILEGITIGTK